jgi:predicted dehydrogenase
MVNPPFRFGIFGTANIARKNWRGIHETGNSIVAAVASRDLERSRQFIGECQSDVPFASAPQAFGSYEELLASKAVDAVYIPLPTGLRKEWVLKAARAGKHVVCEKPCAVTVSDLREMLDTSRQHRVQFLDGVMFMHSHRLERMRAVLDDKQSVGQIRRITSAFSFKAPPDFFTSNIRARGEMEPHGCVGDLGWYCIRLSLWAMGWQMPREVSGRILNQFQAPGGSTAVPTEFSGELVFDGGVSASFYCSFMTALEQWASITGTEGRLNTPDFVLPNAGSESAFEVEKLTFDVKGCEFKLGVHPTKFTSAEHSHGHPTAQEANLFRNFANQAQSGQLNENWSDMALKTQIVMGACIESARSGKGPIKLS